MTISAMMFNQKDMDAALVAVDRMEAAPNPFVLTGDVPIAFNLKEFSLELEGIRRSLRMMLLKTGQISSDIRAAQNRLAANPKSKQAANDIQKCFRAVKWHQKASEAIRISLRIPAQTKFLTLGQMNDMGLLKVAGFGSAKQPASFEDSGLNSLEELYYQDRREERWPFEQCFADFGVGYRGWLQWKFENGLIDMDTFHLERARLIEGGANA